MINEYLNDKIEMTEEICGTLTASEKQEIKNDLFQKFNNFAGKIGVNVEEILSDIDIVAELDELIDYDFETAKNAVLN